MIGLMRASASSGIAALERAHSKGRTQGHEEGQRHAIAGRTVEVQNHQLEQLRETMKAFEEASGLKLRNQWDAGPVGAAVKVLLHKSPDRVVAVLQSAADHARATATTAEKSIEAIREAMAAGAES